LSDSQGRSTTTTRAICAPIATKAVTVNSQLRAQEIHPSTRKILRRDDGTTRSAPHRYKLDYESIKAVNPGIILLIDRFA